ncbi:hypothetical protein BD779DRAFT_1725271 [Infundibulicybe gibba]|nr:hypothetical protein BD779DRAFT_1725271 [Infundibulicybe gibba]
MAKGEIPESIASGSGTSVIPYDGHDTSYEWPGRYSYDRWEETLIETPLDGPTTKSKTSWPLLRLVVQRTSILPSKHRIANVDGYSELEIGRDVGPPATNKPRVRLKEMQVSKLHATVYWDAQRREWAVVDMGSKHGTFLCSSSTTDGDKGARLSPPRVASIPRRIQHLDQLTIGGTTFHLHIHRDQLAYPIISQSEKGPPSASIKRVEAGTASPPAYTPKAAKNPKEALSMLRRNLLTSHPGVATHAQASLAKPVLSYTDRSARRRALHPTSHADSPGVPALMPIDSPTSHLGASTQVDLALTSEPAAPLDSNNVGHMLLMKQGWDPGTALGTSSYSADGHPGLVEPLEVSFTTHRAGLGSKSVMSAASQSGPETNWKESGKHERWDRLRDRELR